MVREFQGGKNVLWLILLQMNREHSKNKKSKTQSSVSTFIISEKISCFILIKRTR